jgi:hypothetical protein
MTPNATGHRSIGENNQRSPRVFWRAILFLLVLSFATTAAAQSPPPTPPRVELGADALVMGGLVDLSNFKPGAQSSLVGVDLTMRTTLVSRFALEGRVALSNVSTTVYEFGAVIRTRPPTPHRWTPFIRLGAAGHREVEQVPESRHENQDRSTTVYPGYTHYKATPPNFAVAGGGLQRAISRRLAAITELDVIIGSGLAGTGEQAEYFGAGLRASIGVFIPLGAYGGR